MSPRAWSRARSSVLFVLFALLVAGVSSGRTDEPVPAVPTDAPIGAEVGAGWLGKALCLGCATVYVAAGGLTIGGTVVAILLYPEGAAACAFICIKAF